MTPHVDKEAVVQLFEKIRTSFPNLEMRLDAEPRGVDLAMDIPQQHGLSFPVHVSLQGDELHLKAGAFWLEWFPCSEKFISDTFFNAVTGVLSGRFRIVEYYRGDKAIKAELQELRNDDWKTIGTWSCLHLPFPLRKTIKILHNAQQDAGDNRSPR